jgi:ankyrin repeat protein
MLINAGANVNAVNLDGESALHYSCLTNHTPAIALLLFAHGINVDIKNKDGDTALHLCCGYGRQDIAQMLIDADVASADLDQQNNEGDTPLHLAFFNEQPEIALMLVNNGANVRVINNVSIKCIYAYIFVYP